ncbi:hypothetical protein ACHAWF_011601 [Thalassiosira exigua]
MPSDADLVAVATRLHLGHASHPPPRAQLRETLASFARLASSVGADRAVVAVDSEEKLEGYDLVREVTEICRSLNDGEDDAPAPATPIHVLPVTPWEKFIPALNAIVIWCARNGARRLLLASAEVQLTQKVMEVMKQQLDMDRTLVVGTTLRGHEHKSTYGEEVEVELNGRTTPWNTCALWNLPKLALTGFLLVSEGLHPAKDGGDGLSGGVEEVCTIATLQRILGPEKAQAKLISIPGTSWQQDFGNDEKRNEWHEKKMKSKYTRAKRQLELMGLTGTVIHC